MAHGWRIRRGPIFPRAQFFQNPNHELDRKCVRIPSPCGNSEKEEERYSIVSRDFSEKPCGVR